MTTLNKPETREPTYSELLDILLQPSDAVWLAPAAMSEPIALTEPIAEPTAESVLDKCNNFWREFNKMVKDYQNERTRVFELEDKAEAIAEEEKVNELWVPRINALWEQGRTISSRK